MTDLMARKKRVANTRAVGELLTVLKERLTETNLNLRARVLQCIRGTAEAIGEETQQYTALVVPELLKLCGETKQNVVEGLFAALTAWVGAHAASPAIFNSLVGSLVQGLKITKGRAGLLRWVNHYAGFLERASCATLLSSVMDCLTSKEAAVRAEAATLMKVVCAHLSQGEVEAKIVGRPSPDMNTLHQIVDRLYTSGRFSSASARLSDMPITAPVTGLTAGLTAGLTTGFATESAAGTVVDNRAEAASRKQSLSARPGARVLARPNPGEGLRARFQHVKSSIPKPQPRRQPFSDAFSARDFTASRVSGGRGEWA